MSIEATLCPHCGAALERPAAPPPDWPPPPPGAAPASPPAKTGLVTSSAGNDVVLGVVVSVLSILLAGLGVLVMPVLYFTMRRGTPHFARGVGYGFLGGVALLLGALALCVVGLSGLNPGSR